MLCLCYIIIIINFYFYDIIFYMILMIILMMIVFCYHYIVFTSITTLGSSQSTPICSIWMKKNVDDGVLFFILLHTLSIMYLLENTHNTYPLLSSHHQVCKIYYHFPSLSLYVIIISSSSSFFFCMYHQNHHIGQT